MRVPLNLGGIKFDIYIDREVTLEKTLEPFLRDGEEADVKAYVTFDYSAKKLPCGRTLGSDLLQEYRETDGGRCALAIVGGGIYQAASYYSDDCREIHCHVNGKICKPENINVGTLMRFLPMRAVMSRFGALFFHASQIVYKNKGILFTAPSGTGKTTQAKLWRDTAGAEIICNDRTLIRKLDGEWLTYGYPLDGSEPVRSNRVNSLGCIVVLEQGKENEIKRLVGIKAVAAMMNQLVMDSWDDNARLRAIELLADMMTDIPVYRLACTPTEEAVMCLKQKLTDDGVI